jgi:hypothetical protein
MGRTGVSRPKLLNAGMLMVDCLIHFFVYGPDTSGRSVPVLV